MGTGAWCSRWVQLLLNFWDLSLAAAHGWCGHGGAGSVDVAIARMETHIQAQSAKSCAGDVQVKSLNGLVIALDGASKAPMKREACGYEIVEGSGEHTPIAAVESKRGRQQFNKVGDLRVGDWDVEVFDSDGVVDADEVDSLMCKRARAF
ncbi:uncharacterized protein [Lolium perenne]|uniref:uncharacterized protein isoform X3 n=1 Tax=Lolium perenne TaxID=4522 RepID=UPI0021F614EF|nr:uncharacterized protein LOC127327936 isoform X3 [Lolium perenne]